MLKLPPDYMGGDACAECWEPFGNAWPLGWLDRFLHRRKWGHNPTPLRSPPLAQDRHAKMVEAARAYREWHTHA